MTIVWILVRAMLNMAITAAIWTLVLRQQATPFLAITWFILGFIFAVVDHQHAYRPVPTRAARARGDDDVVS